jgi:serine/threonine protein phosphatase PrpC
MVSIINQIPLQSAHVIQHLSKQDWVNFGKNDEFDYMITADSHGCLINKTMLIDLFNETDWSEILSTDTWCEEIIKKSNINSFKVGSTLTVLKIYPERIECYWIGDSSAKIYEFDEENKASLLWRTKDHDYNHKNDCESMLADKELFSGIIIKDTFDIQAITPTTVLSVPSKTFRIGTEGVNMTRVLGHQGCFAKYGFDKAVINRKKDRTYKAVAGTDGFWQVMSVEDISFISDKCNDSECLAKKARERWEQAWTHDNSFGVKKEKVYFPKHNWDDVGVTTWSN